MAAFAQTQNKAQSEDLPAGENVLLLLDASSSMKEQLGPMSKLDLARAGVIDLIKRLPDNFDLAYAPFADPDRNQCNAGGGAKVSPYGETKNHLIRQVGKPRAEQIMALHRTMTAYTGPGSPSLTKAIIISDGSPACAEQICAWSKSVAGAVERLETYIVMLTAAGEPSQALQCIADATDGEIFSVGDASEMKSAIALIDKRLNWLATFYSEDFESEGGAQWTLILPDGRGGKTEREATPIGSRRFLGRFVNDKIEFWLEEVPPHNYLQVSFDLYLTGTWDGYHERWGGPDRWRFGLRGEAPMFEAVFSTGPGRDYLQSYPGKHPHDRYRSHTGAAERGTLGYMLAKYNYDAVYHFSFLFAHDELALALEFIGDGLQHKHDEAWGIDNFLVQYAPSVHAEAENGDAATDLSGEH